MPAFSRAVFLGLQAAAVVSLVGQPFSSSSTALAAPVPLPMPMVAHIADYAAQPPARNNATELSQSRPISLVRKQDGAAVVHHTTSESSPVVARDGDIDTSLLNNINILGNMYSQMNDHSHVLNELASQASSMGDNEEFHQRVYTETDSYRQSLLGFESILEQLGADKGLANYDRTDDLETLLKEIINLNKESMKSVVALVEQMPAVGPALAQIVYEVKCIMDEMLNAVENLTDAIINALKPLLIDLIGTATEAACSSGLELGSLCLMI
ncbi:hypothetical protein C8Q77DRAFT_58291 [Trametes polyzona]|nr:hypothetical protein C8Q77DRAFT_58291 [Trametes polyzona]